MLRSGLALALITAVVLLTTPAPLWAQDITLPGVTLNGEASLTAQPDQAEIRAGVVTHGKTAREAIEANGRTMTAVLATMREAGIEPNDVQTSRIGVQPVMSKPQLDNRSEQPRISGYQVTNMVTVRTRNVPAIGDLIDRLIAAGTNTIWGLEFQVADSSKLLDKVRAAAIADAKRKAEIYAHAAGAQLGRIIAISETSSTVPKFAMMRGASVASTPIAPGEETLRVSITATYELIR